MITVAFTVSCRRPRYLRRAVESWAACRRPEEVRFLFSLESPPRYFNVAGFEQWAWGALGQRPEIVIWPQHQGCNRNTYHALRLGLDVRGASDFAVVAEEDIEVADDTLEYFAWARDAYQDRPEVLAACAHVKEAGDGGPADCHLAPWFSPLVWGTWRDRWRLLEPGWEAHPDAWDGYVRNFGAADPARCCVFPALSRSFHFGETSTMTPRRADGAPNYFHLTALSSCFRPEYGPQDYREARVAGVTLY